MRGLISHERFQRSRHYLKSAAECTSRAIVSLELSESAVKSPRQAEKLEGIGGETASRLKKYADEKKFSNSKPMGGIYTSAAGAILVALLECEERQIANGHSPERSILVPEVILKRSARSLSEEELLPEGSTGFCQAWWRIEVLIKRDYIKRRSHHKSPVYTLLPLGRETAHRLRGDDDITSSVMPVPSVNPLRSSVTPRSSSTPTTTTADALYTNDSGKDGIIMLIDCSEMGGDRVALGQLCAMLDKQSVIYKTKRLASGDYGWIWRTYNTEKELPFLVERKRADDLSRSLKEGRFLPQIQKMVVWKNTFTDKGTDSMLYYLLEGHPEDYVVKCADGCQGVGMCGYPNLTQIKVTLPKSR
ncbi:hypothetical protein FSP39_017049 [Pinctada imbricata]|uniref:Crossover junction endonuclease MUS81 n=1 Tax=Pinctada imbricata TaxID=66713 RepID=A0AA89BV26_PINIB|nr:hypothetical protein FSP39_017049 [Pinctada imbricata]